MALMELVGGAATYEPGSRSTAQLNSAFTTSSVVNTAFPGPIDLRTSHYAHLPSTVIRPLLHIHMCPLHPHQAPAICSPEVQTFA